MEHEKAERINEVRFCPHAQQCSLTPVEVVFELYNRVAKLHKTYTEIEYEIEGQRKQTCFSRGIDGNRVLSQFYRIGKIGDVEFESEVTPEHMDVRYYEEKYGGVKKLIDELWQEKVRKTVSLKLKTGNHNTFKVIAICIGMLFAFGGYAYQETTKSGVTYNYNVENGVASIIKRGYYGYERAVELSTEAPTDIIVPDMLGGYPVRSIGYDAFYGSRITSIIIPNCVTNIDCAFTACNSLTNMVLPFVGKSRECDEEPKAVFGSIFGYSSYTDGDTTYQYYTGGLMSYSPTVSSCIPKTLGSVVITDTACIPNGAFSNCRNIKRIIISSGRTNLTIRAAAFYNCGITNMILPSCVSYIGDRAFCGSIREILLSNDIERITLCSMACDSETATIKIADKEGYVFGGWRRSDTHQWVSDPFRMQTMATVEPYWQKPVTVSYDANGGLGTMVNQTVLSGRDLVLLANCFTRQGFMFRGWAKSANDEVLYVDRQTINGVPEDFDGTVLYAMWSPMPPEIEPAANMSFSGVSQSISILCETGEATILYTTDGSNPKTNGREYKRPFDIYNSCTIRAIALADGVLDSDEASATFTRADSLSEAVNLYGYTMETDETHPWTVVTDVSHDGVSSVRSGEIGNNEATYLQASVRKAGTVSFWWKAQCEEAEIEDDETYWYDYGAFLVDGVVKARIAGLDTGWQYVSVDVAGGGKHTLRWEYSKDGATSYSPDCVWLDQVQWTPADGSGFTMTTPEQVSYSWLSQYGFGGRDADFETAASAPSGKRDGSGKVTSIWEEWVAGTDPTNEMSRFSAKIEMRDGLPVLTWEPDLNENGSKSERLYKVYGKETLSDVDWVYPTNTLHRFFKVTVEMP